MRAVASTRPSYGQEPGSGRPPPNSYRGGRLVFVAEAIVPRALCPIWARVESSVLKSTAVVVGMPGSLADSREHLGQKPGLRPRAEYLHPLVDDRLRDAADGVLLRQPRELARLDHVGRDALARDRHSVGQTGHPW